MKLFTTLGIIFIVLKLTDLIDWSWWLVLLPLYGFFIFATLLVLAVLIAFIAEEYIK